MKRPSPFLPPYVLIILALGVVGCSTRQSTMESRTTSAESESWVSSTLASLTLEEKIGQLIHVWTLTGYLPQSGDDWLELERLVREKNIGGFIFSIGDPYEYAVQANKLQRMAKVPLLVAADFEWGAGMRVRKATTFPRAMAIGATRNPQFAYDAGYITGLEARALGVHQNYAPTVDVNNNPRNPVINTRAFGDDVGLVTQMSTAFVRGTQDAGVIATVKHFPGHGDTDVDTHLGLSTIPFSKARLDTFELPPYKETFRAGAMSVMVGHLSVLAYDTIQGIPATVSPNVSTTLLKSELGFQGLVVTDAMVMEGVAERYHPAEAVVLAIKAGMDLILMPVDADVAIDALLSAVKRGEITEERIDHSVRKVLESKAHAGLHVNRFVDVENVGLVVNKREHRLKALEIARHAVTVLGNETGVLPLTSRDTMKIADIVITDEDQPEDGVNVHRMIRSRRNAPVFFGRIDPTSNSAEFDSALALASRADLVVIQLHLHTRSGAMTGFVDSAQAALVNRIKGLGKPTVGISVGNPYVAMALPRFDAYVCTYSDADVTQQALVEVLFAEEPARGKLPVGIPGFYAYGDGVAYPKLRLRYGEPEEVAVKREALGALGKAMRDAISDTAFPGGVVLAARNGVIFHEEGYGTFDDSVYSRAVDRSTMYDLASVTKVIATTGAVMRLVDEGRIRLTDPVATYVPEFGRQGKERITIYNLMVHNSGLPAWRKFYEICDSPACVLDSIWATPLIYRTGDSTLYSDLGLITMGVLVGRVAGAPLDAFVDSVFFKPLGMRHTMFNPPERVRGRIAPTEVDTYWMRTGLAPQGRVHDENAATLGGVSGHAGLFSTAGDLAIYLQMLLNGGTYEGRRYLEAGTIKEFTRRQSEKSSRGIGWDTKSSDRSFTGRYSSMRTFLHTGFTGTSVMADPENNLIIILLTNRVYPTRNTTKIFRVRPAVHEALYRGLEPVESSVQ